MIQQETHRDRGRAPQTRRDSCQRKAELPAAAGPMSVGTGRSGQLFALFHVAFLRQVDPCDTSVLLCLSSRAVTTSGISVRAFGRCCHVIFIEVLLRPTSPGPLPPDWCSPRGSRRSRINVNTPPTARPPFHVSTVLLQCFVMIRPRLAVSFGASAATGRDGWQPVTASMRRTMERGLLT